MVNFDSNDDTIRAEPPVAIADGSPLRRSGHAGQGLPRGGELRCSINAAEFSAIAAVASIIGDDDRTILFETRSRPGRLICALRINAPAGPFHGTGWLAGPRLVVTCGHCVFHPAMGGWASLIEVAPGLSEDVEPFGTVAANRFSAAREWTRNGDKAFDIGAIHLAEPLGDRVGWFAIQAAADPRALVGRRATISGYPLFDGGYTRQMRHADNILAAADGRLFYPIDTDEGQSGAPMWLDAEDPADPEVVGIHAYESQQTPNEIGVEANSGTPITPEILQLIDAWRQVQV